LINTNFYFEKRIAKIQAMQLIPQKQVLHIYYQATIELDDGKVHLGYKAVI